MKKLILLIFICFIISNSSTISFHLTNNATAKPLQDYVIKTYNFTVTFPDINQLIKTNNPEGKSIRIDDGGFILIPGKPMLPKKNFMIALPPGSTFLSIAFNEQDTIQLPGLYSIPPVESIISLESYNSVNQKIIDQQWKENYNETYRSDKPYPEERGKINGIGSLREYPYISVSLCPFNFYPLSNKLEYSQVIDLVITYQKSSDYHNQIKSDMFTDEKAKELFTNFNDIKDYYIQSQKKILSPKEKINYLILTTDELQPIVTSSEFYSWKTFLGYNVKTITISDPMITNQPGIDLTEQIRNFLRKNYLEWDMRYLLIVGDYTSIPMRYCSPNPNWLSGTVPTDTYYADLSFSDSKSWDSNGDGYYGVYQQDNPDFIPEIYVGRIPTNDISKVMYTLQKIMLFEQDTGNWKNHALMGGAMLFYAHEDHDETIGFDIDGARLNDLIEKDIMLDWKVSQYSEYKGLSPSIYPFSSLTETAFTSDWRNGQYAVVNWAAHGAPASIGRVIWSWDDGDGIPEHDNGELTWGSFLSTYSYLQGDYPSIVFAVSCNVGYPEPTPDGNLGIDLLTKESFGAAVAVCSSTRGAAVAADWVASHSGAEALCYEFNRYMINGPLPMGMALYDSKAYVHYNFGWDHEYEYMNMYDYNLYGDPSMRREGLLDGSPDIKNIIGPTSGNIGKEYFYNFSSLDPSYDDVYYYIDWGDGKIDEWVGPFSSADVALLTHEWSTAGTYNIKAKVKDVDGLESEWTFLDVNMPKSKISFVPFIRFLDNHPHLFSLIKRVFE